MEDSNKVLYDILIQRLEHLRELDKEGDSDQRRHIAEETASLYAPLAHRLGLYQIKTEMEDLALKFTNYTRYKYIALALNAKKSERDAYIDRFIAPLKERLEKEGFKFTIKGRPKSIHSISHKMDVQHCDVDRIYDLFAIRIILDSPLEKEKSDCWQVYSIITDIFPPNPKRLRDWLSSPKENGYESLHTTVLGPDNRWVEVQIRTERMDQVAEKGVAAHWSYKGINARQTAITPTSVYVFTPAGDLRRLPAGATVLDFAYSVHSEVGGHCVGARIHGQFVPIRHQLQNGDQIEILTSTTQKPNADWLSFVTSVRAKHKIKQALNRMMAPAEPEQEVPKEPEKPVPARHTPHRNGVYKKPDQPLSLEVDLNMRNVDLNVASCCNPKPGDEIFGFVSVTRGIRIHKLDCPNAESMLSRFPYRVLPARWTERKTDAPKES